MKSISPKREADDVISRTGCALLPFAGRDSSGLLAIFSCERVFQRKDRQRFHKQFDANCRKIGSRSQGRGRRGEERCRRARLCEEENKVKSYTDALRVCSVGLSLPFRRVIPFENIPLLAMNLPFICCLKSINGPEPSRTILAVSLMKTLCGGTPAQ